MTEPDASPIALQSHGVTWARVRLARVLGRAALVALLVPTILDPILRFLEAPLTIRMWMSGSSLLFLALTLASFVVWFRRAAISGAVMIDDAGLAIEQYGAPRRHIARADVASAYLVHRFARGGYVPVVEVELRGGDLVSFDVADEQTARRCVDMLGFGPGKHRVRIDLGTPTRRVFNFGAGAFGYFMGAVVSFFANVTATFYERPQWHSGFLVAAVIFGCYAFLRRMLRAPELTIGDDGVSYRVAQTKRFYPREELVGIEHRGTAQPLVLHTRRGAVSIRGSALDLERRVAAGRLIHERLFADRTAVPEQARALFAREGRPVAAWREALRTRIGEVGYRELASPIDVAGAVLESPTSTPDERVGAALALREAGVDPVRIRVAASAAADRRLRVALETVAESDDDELLEKRLRKLFTGSVGR